jgi:hypothetical protein
MTCMGNIVRPFGAIFQDVRRRYEIQATRDPDLICADGFHGNCDVLKWRKASWTNDDPTNIKSPMGGIFFSIWITEDGGRAGRAEYNLHSYGLGKLPAYKIAAREFCGQFRAAFSGISGSWPNVRTDFGPGTLMQGWFKIHPKSLADQVLTVVGEFREVAMIIDHLLAQRTKVATSRRKPSI